MSTHIPASPRRAIETLSSSTVPPPSSPRKLARDPSHVCVIGPPGSGKSELVQQLKLLMPVQRFHFDEVHTGGTSLPDVTEESPEEAMATPPANTRQGVSPIAESPVSSPVPITQSSSPVSKAAASDGSSTSSPPSSSRTTSPPVTTSAAASSSTTSSSSTTTTTATTNTTTTTTSSTTPKAKKVGPLGLATNFAKLHLKLPVTKAPALTLLSPRSRRPIQGNLPDANAYAICVPMERALEVKELVKQVKQTFRPFMVYITGGEKFLRGSGGLEALLGKHKTLAATLGLDASNSQLANFKSSTTPRDRAGSLAGGSEGAVPGQAVARFAVIHNVVHWIESVPSLS